MLESVLQYEFILVPLNIADSDIAVCLLIFCINLMTMSCPLQLFPPKFTEDVIAGQFAVCDDFVLLIYVCVFQ